MKKRHKALIVRLLAKSKKAARAGSILAGRYKRLAETAQALAR